MLKLNKVYLDYGNGKGVKNLSFQVSKGKICGVLGSNGCGKTTTFRLILGLLKPNEGSISLDSKELDRANSRMLGYLPEERSLLRNLSVYEQVHYLSKLKKMSDEEIEEGLDYYLDYLNISNYKYHKISDLSKGNQQKIQMICALVHNPKIVIFDEPLNGLDIDNVELFKKLLLKLRNEKKIILISSHQYNNIEQYCDSVVYLKDGRIVFKGNVNNLKKRVDKRYMRINTHNKKYLKSNGVVSHYYDGAYLILEMKDQDSCYELVKVLIADKIEDFSSELTSLKDIIKEKVK